MFTNNKFGKFDAVADAIKNIAEADYKAKMEELKGQQHKIDKNKNNKIDAHDFAILRGEKKGMKKEEAEQIDELKTSTLLRYQTKANQALIGGDRNKEEKRIKGIQTANYKIQSRHKVKEEAENVEESNNPFDLKNYKSQLPTKPGEKAGFDSKKVSTGTIYSRKPVKDEPMKKEEIDPNDTTTDTLKGREKTSNNPFLSKKVKMDVPDNVKEEAEDLDEAVSLSDAKTTAERLVKKTIAAHGISNPTSAKHYAKNASAIESTLNRAKKAFTPGHLANAHSPVSSNQAANRRSNEQNSMSSADKRAHATLQAGVVKHLQKHLDQHNAAFTNAAAKYASKNKTNEEVEQINELEFTIGDVENFMQTEEFEQLNELSKNLVHRYYGKAIRNHAAALEKDIDMGDEHQKIKRLMAKTNKGIQLGSRGKNPINTPEVQKHLKAASDAVAKMREPAKKLMAKREKGIDKAEVKVFGFRGGKDRDGNKVVKATGKLTKEEVEQIDERTLTKGETAEKERIVKGMKKSLKGFKARYGDKAKEVMYATATARAKK